MTERQRKTTLSLDEARALALDALTASNVSASNAAVVADALVAAERDGQGGHGLARVPAYAAQARAGKVNGHAAPAIDRIAPALLRIDAGHGFAYPAIDLAVEKLPSVARGAGLAAATVSRSHHAGVMGAHVERMARAGLVAIMVANAPKAMAPWGGSRPLYGTNPIAFASPVEGAEPLVIDLSLSRVARGKVMRAAQRGEPVPEGWALDADGHPTTDAEAALAGTMVPAGEAKGAALALMVEVLAASLTGASHSFEASSFFDAEGPPPGTGQFLLAIDPRAAGQGFGGRIAALVAEIEAQEGARLPGTSRLAARERATRDGIRIDDDLLASIRALSASPYEPPEAPSLADEMTDDLVIDVSDLIEQGMEGEAGGDPSPDAEHPADATHAARHEEGAER